MPNEFRGREPAKESHGEVVGAAIADSKLLCEVVECVKAVAGAKAFLVLPVTALHIAIVARGIRTDCRLPNKWTANSLEENQPRGLMGKLLERRLRTASCFAKSSSA